MVCVPGLRTDYVLLEVAPDVALDLLANRLNPLGQSYGAIRPTPGRGVRGHDGRHYDCACHPVGLADETRRRLRLARGISVADLGAFDEVIVECITASNLTAAQMADLNDLWDRCVTQERRGRLNDTWYYVGIVFICISIFLGIVLLVSCLLWSTQLQQWREGGFFSRSGDGGGEDYDYENARVDVGNLRSKTRPRPRPRSRPKPKAVRVKARRQQHHQQQQRVSSSSAELRWPD